MFNSDTEKASSLPSSMADFRKIEDTTPLTDRSVGSDIRLKAKQKQSSPKTKLS